MNGYVRMWRLSKLNPLCGHMQTMSAPRKIGEKTVRNQTISVREMVCQYI
jgi:hypothetical protein